MGRGRAACALGRLAFPPALLAALALLAPRPAAAQPAPLQGLDDYVTTAMEAWNVPGLALAVIADGEVVHARGYGVRDVRTGAPVDEHTLFAVGSTSKAFTSAALGLLVDEGRVSWDDRVIDHIPWFAMYDAYATRELTVRDLLTHRSGLARGDAVWSRWPHDRHEIIRRIRFLEPTRSFRGAWQYQNLMFLTAGEVVRAASGQTWDDFVDDRIFTPLGMDRSVTSVTELDRLDNVATPHVHVADVATPVAHKNIDNVGPAGSIYSSVSQMARWVSLHLTGGVHAGERLFSDSVMAEMHRPQMLIQADAPENSLHPRDAPMNFNAYGLAWWVLDYRGRKVVDHGGGIDGMRAHVAFMPEEGLGMVALSNARPNNLIVALMYRVFDHHLSGEEGGGGVFSGPGDAMADWSALMLAEYRESSAAQADARSRRAADRATGTAPSRPLTEYAGTFGHQYYGAIDITHADGALSFSFGGKTTGRLEHWHYDVFRAVPDNPANGAMFFTFTVGPDGVVGVLEVEGLGTFGRS
ncbi:MAG: serine hydrolase [Gemmatimonadetes bacterium]|nr:serine hydrolase [Gemmatimonadota bacterium]